MFTRLRTKSVDYPFTLLFDIVLTQKLWVYYLPHIPRDHELRLVMGVFQFIWHASMENVVKF